MLSVFAVSFSDIIDPVNVLIALSALGVTIYFAKKNQRRPALTLRASSTELVSIDEQARDDIQILYNNEPVRGVKLVQARVQNTGNKEVRKGDFEAGPLRVTLDGDAQALIEPSASGEPHALSDQVDVAFTNGELTITPLTLNPGASLTVKLLVRDFSGSPVFQRPVVAGVNDEWISTQGDEVARAFSTPRRWVLIAIGCVLLVGAATAGAFFAGPWVAKDDLVQLRSDEQICGRVKTFDGQRITVDNETLDPSRTFIISIGEIEDVRMDDCGGI